MAKHEKPETVQIAAARAAKRWRTMTIGLLIVGLTNLANAAMNAAQLGQQPVVCVGERLPEQAFKQAVDDQARRLGVPQR